MERKVSLYKYSGLYTSVQAFLALAGTNLLILANHVNKEVTINTKGNFIARNSGASFRKTWCVFQMSGYEFVDIKYKR